MALKLRNKTWDCLPLHQGKSKMYAFSAKAKDIWKVVQINLRDPDKDKGYQRVLSTSRVRAISAYLDKGHPIPGSILVTFETAEVSADGRKIKVPLKPNAGWVIDGQHRLAGAHLANEDVDLSIVAFIGLTPDEQVQQFVTINREAKGVPTSLYYDLLKHLPPLKSSGDKAKERSADIANELRKDEDSPFFSRIVITTSPKRGELSLTNFVRKIHPLVLDGRILAAFSVLEQTQIISNYYQGLRIVFPKEFDKTSTVFFQTVGFGGLINALPTFFTLCLKHYKSFKVEDVSKLFAEIKHFDFSGWEQLGSGSAAEVLAGEDLKAELTAAVETITKPSGLLDLGTK